MPTIIDALVVTLGLDPSGFKKGQAETDAALKKTRENTARHTKEIESDAKRAAAGFRSMRNEVLGLVGISLSLSGAAKMIERITTSDAAAGRLAKNIGATTKELTAWQNIAEKFGSSSEDVSAAFRRLNEMQQSLLIRGSTGVDDALARLLGSDRSKFMQRSATVMERMALLQKAVANAANPQEAQGFLSQIGLSEGMFTMFRELGSRREELLAEQGRMNSASDEDARLAIERKKAWAELTQAIEKTARAITNSGLIDLTQGIRRLAAEITVFTDKLPRSWRELFTFKDPVDERLVGKPARALKDLMTDPKGVMSNTARDIGTARNWLFSFLPEGMRPRPWRLGGGGAGASASSGDDEAFRYGTAAFAEMLANDIRAGAEFRWRAGAAGQMTGGGSTSKTEVHINTLQVNTSAATGPGIAADIAAALRKPNLSLASQAASGLK